MKKSTFVASVFLVSVPSLSAMPAFADITWAVAGPYTGSLASIGQAQQAGIKQAVEDINAAGGVLGQNIVLKIYDDACDPKQAVSVANKIVANDLHIVMHGSCSSASIAASKVYIDEGTVVVNSVSSNPQITEGGGPTLFRAIYRDDQAALVLADTLFKKYNHKKLAILHDKSTYGQGLAEFVRDKLDAKGFKADLFEPYDPESHDYSVLASRLKQRGIDVVFIAGAPVPIAMITRQLHEAGAKTQIYAGDLDDPDFWRVAGTTGEGAEFSSATDPRKEPGAKSVVDKLQKAGTTVDAYTLYGYAAAQALAAAIIKAGSTDPNKISDALHKGEFPTILGKWSFDAKGDVRNIRLVMYRWHDGQFEETGE